MFQPLQTLQVQLHNQLFAHHSFSKFHAFRHSFQRFSTVPVQNLQLQLHIIPILQMQTTFYNCTNCHQLHVKICPDLM